MATTTATITIASTDLLTDELSLASTSTLTKAGTSTGVEQASGLSRKETATVGSTALIDSVVLYRADDYTDDGANKVYIKNISTTPAEYITVYLTGDRGGETHTPANALTELGRLYAGDWTFFPWNATAGTKEVATCEITGTWAAGDSIEFDGVTIVSPGSGLNELATAMDAAHYPNWTTTVSTATVTFTSRQSRADLEIDTDEFTIVDLAGSNATITVATGTDGKKSASDIYIKPSVETGIIYECMLIHE